MNTRRLSTHPATAQRRPWPWAVWGALLGAVLAALCWAPARWLAWGVAEASQGRVLLQSPRGTLWQGSAQLSLSGGAGSRDLQALPGRMAWSIGLGTHGLALSLHADCCMSTPWLLRVTAGIGQWGLHLNPHQSLWPARLLTGLGAPWNTLQVEGQMQLRNDELHIQWAAGRLQWQGLLELTARDVASRLSTLRPMGSYLLKVASPSGNTPTAPPQLELSTLSGALRLNGQGQWLGDRLRFAGEASAADGQEAALSNLLNIIGRRDGSRSLLSLG